MSFKKPHATGIRDTWKLWRYCLCRHGWYPLLVSPFVTIGFLLDLYSSLDCHFLRVNIGFTPANEEWSDPQIDVGFWSYHGDEGVVDNQPPFRNDKIYILPGCTEYSPEFSDFFIGGDKAWSAAKIMGMTSGVAGAIACVSLRIILYYSSHLSLFLNLAYLFFLIADLTLCSYKLTIWLMTTCPLPAWFVWPGILLPSTLIGFLAGGAKFFIVDSSICTKSMWLPFEDAGYREVSDSCTFLRGAYLSIASIVCFFIAICLIFYNVPDLRELDPDYGKDPINNNSAADLEKAEPVVGKHGSMIVCESPQDITPITTSETSSAREGDSRKLYNEVSQTRVEAGVAERDGVEDIMEQVFTYLKESGSQIEMPSTNRAFSSGEKSEIIKSDKPLLSSSIHRTPSYAGTGKPNNKETSHNTSRRLQKRSTSIPTTNNEYGSVNSNTSHESINKKSLKRKKYSPVPFEVKNNSTTSEEKYYPIKKNNVIHEEMPVKPEEATSMVSNKGITTYMRGINEQQLISLNFFLFKNSSLHLALQSQ